VCQLLHLAIQRLGTLADWERFAVINDYGDVDSIAQVDRPTYRPRFVFAFWRNRLFLRLQKTSCGTSTTSTG